MTVIVIYQQPRWYTLCNRISALSEHTLFTIYLSRLFDHKPTCQSASVGYTMIIPHFHIVLHSQKWLKTDQNGYNGTDHLFILERQKSIWEAIT